MAYEQGLKPLKQVQLSTLSPVMWSLKGGYPRKPMMVPIGNGMSGCGCSSASAMSGPEECTRGQIWNPVTHRCVDANPPSALRTGRSCMPGYDGWIISPITRRCEPMCRDPEALYNTVTRGCVSVCPPDMVRRKGACYKWTPMGALGIDDSTVAMIGSTAGLLVLLPVAAFLGIAALGVLSNVVNGREPFSY